MATIRLIPSSYTRSNTNYVTVSNPTNMYNNTDHTANYATLQGRTRNSSTAYYAFIGGFNFDDVPSNAIVSSFTIKIRAYRNSYQRTGTNFYLRLTYGSSSGTVISGTTLDSNLGTTSDVYTFPNGNIEWSDFATWGDDFSIEVPLAGSSGSYAPQVLVQGAEIEVTYSLPIPHTVTINNSTSATVTASDTSPYEGDDVEIYTNTLSGITIKDNGTDITSQFTQLTGSTINATADSLTTGFSGGSNMAFYTSSSSTGHNFNYAIGHTAESPGSTSSGSGSWTYVKSGSSSTTYTGYADFEFDFSSIPTTATITSVQVKCYGAQEDSSQTTGHADITLYSGNTQKGSTQSFTSSTNSIITLSNVGTWTAEELHEAKLRFAVGYYGGHIFGITWTVTYQVSGYMYTIEAIATDHTITVTSSGGQTTTMYIKVNGSWVAATAVYKKINGSWVQQADLTSVFDSGTNYRTG